VGRGELLPGLREPGGRAQRAPGLDELRPGGAPRGLVPARRDGERGGLEALHVLEREVVEERRAGRGRGRRGGSGRRAIVIGGRRLVAGGEGSGEGEGVRAPQNTPPRRTPIRSGLTSIAARTGFGGPPTAIIT